MLEDRTLRHRNKSVNEEVEINNHDCKRGYRSFGRYGIRMLHLKRGWCFGLQTVISNKNASEGFAAFRDGISQYLFPGFGCQI